MEEQVSFAEISHVLSLRDRHSNFFTTICDMLDECMRKNGIIPPQAPSVNAAFLTSSLDDNKFCSFCFCPVTYKIKLFFWGTIQTTTDNEIVLVVERALQYGQSQTDKEHAIYRGQMLCRLLYEYVISHYVTHNECLLTAKTPFTVWIDFPHQGTRKKYRLVEPNHDP